MMQRKIFNLVALRTFVLTQTFLTYRKRFWGFFAQIDRQVALFQNGIKLP
jgi:hypothetical protein